jgi:hypothetical protein
MLTLAPFGMLLHLGQSAAFVMENTPVKHHEIPWLLKKEVEFNGGLDMFEPHQIVSEI